MVERVGVHNRVLSVLSFIEKGERRKKVQCVCYGYTKTTCS